MEKFKPFIIPVALLVLIDQMVKIVISKVFMKYEFDIIAKVLRFNPPQNTLSIKLHKHPDMPQIIIIFTQKLVCALFAWYSIYPDKKRNKTNTFNKMVTNGLDNNSKKLPA